VISEFEIEEFSGVFVGISGGDGTGVEVMQLLMMSDIPKRIAAIGYVDVLFITPL
jgi:hypothetical protein